MEKTEAVIREYFAWRHEWQVGSALDRPLNEVFPNLQEMHPHQYHGFSKEGVKKKREERNCENI